MAQELTITQNDIEKINSTEKMAKATLIIVCVAAGVIFLFIMVASVRLLSQPRPMQHGMMGKSMRGQNFQKQLQPKQPAQPNQQTQPGQTQDSSGDTDINTL